MKIISRETLKKLKEELIKIVYKDLERYTNFPGSKGRNIKLNNPNEYEMLNELIKCYNKNLILKPTIFGYYEIAFK